MNTYHKNSLSLIFIVYLLLISFNINAQSHNVIALGCKYYKESPNPGSGAKVNAYEVCQVCKDKKEKERKAKLDEDKRRNDVLVAKIEAENKRKAKEQAENQRLHNEKNKPVNAVIAMSHNTGKSKATTEEKKDVKVEKNYFYSSNYDYQAYEAFLNSKSHMKDNYFKSFGQNYSKDGFLINGKQYHQGKFRACIGKGTDNYSWAGVTFPPNVGIVILDEVNTTHVINPIMDIIDINGNRILNDERICLVKHLDGNLFLVLRGNHYEKYQSSIRPPSEIAGYIYNINTKKKLILKGNKSQYDNKVEIPIGGSFLFGAGDYTAKSYQRYDIKIPCIFTFTLEVGHLEWYQYCFKNENEVEVYQIHRPKEGDVRLIETLKFQ